MPWTLFCLLCLLVACTASGPAYPPIPTVEIAPGVNLPFVNMGGVNVTLLPSYPHGSNYTLWLELGGRGLDTAWEYRTQAAVARAVVASGVPRDQIFITSKIPGSLHGGCCGCPGASPPPICKPSCHNVCYPASGHYTAADVLKYIETDLTILQDNGVDYVDLLLLHNPCDYLAPYPYNATAETSRVYGAMESALRSTDPKLKGRIKAIGVSNFDTEMLYELAKTSTVTPAVNQCRMSVGEYDATTHQYCRTHNITYMAYSTLHGQGISKSSVISSIASKYQVTNQQVVMRWVTQLGVPLVTASNQTKYDEEDLALFSFNLTASEMLQLTNYEPDPEGKCVANAQCANINNSTKGACLADGCQVCATTPPSKSCGSCGCAQCCPGCVLQSSGDLTYCLDATALDSTTFDSLVHH